MKKVRQTFVVIVLTFIFLVVWLIKLYFNIDKNADLLKYALSNFMLKHVKTLNQKGFYDKPFLINDDWVN